MTKIAAEIPILRERRDAAALEGNYDLVTSTNGEIDRMERWRDELFRNSESLAATVKLDGDKQIETLHRKTADSLFELPDFDAIRAAEVGDTTGYSNLHGKYSSLDANVGSKVLLATKIKMMLIIHHYYDQCNGKEGYVTVEQLSDSDAEADTGKAAPVVTEKEVAPENGENVALATKALAPSHSKFKCQVRSNLLQVARDTGYKIPGDLGVACPVSELNTRDKSGMMQMCFGIPAAQCFYSRHIALRASAIKGLESTLLDFACVDSGIQYLTLWKAVLACCIEALNDTNTRIIHATFHLLRTAFMDASGYFNEAMHNNKNRESKCISIEKAVFSLPTASAVHVDNLITGLAYILPTIAKRCGEREYNSATAVQGGGTETELEAQKFVIWLGSQLHIGPTVVVGQLTHLDSGNAVNIQRGRLRLLRVMFETFGTIHTGGIES